VRRELSLTTRAMSSLCSQRNTLRLRTLLDSRKKPAASGKVAVEKVAVRWDDGVEHYLGCGGGGFGVPVVSYAPRPMLLASDSLVIMLLMSVWAALYISNESHSKFKYRPRTHKLIDAACQRQLRRAKACAMMAGNAEATSVVVGERWGTGRCGVCMGKLN
jgi:hypothetical protein